MTTASWSTVVEHSSDATFRTWGSELSGKFSAVGMVQTADTGQINWTTVTRPGTNTAAGYEIWKLSSGNLYFKIEYGTGPQAAIPSFWFTCGTGSNGSGTLTGDLSTRTQCGDPNILITSTVTNYQSYLCATANYFGLSWKIGSSGTTGLARLLLIAAQTVDSTGTANSVGYFVYFSTTSGTENMQCVATTAHVVGSLITTAGAMWFIPMNSSSSPASSTDGAGNDQAFLWWFSILGTSPMAPLLHMANVLKSDLAIGSTASMTLVGTTAHTYLAACQAIAVSAVIVVAATNLNTILLWE